MWCIIDKSNFPIVKISFSPEKQIEAEFDEFLKEWLKLYEEKREFYFIFDTRQLSLLNTKYAYKMSAFIKELKKRDKQYLKKSIVIVKNKYIQVLLNIVFSLTKPVADVYLFSKHSDVIVKEDIENIKTEQGLLNVLEDYKRYFSIIKSKNKKNAKPQDAKSQDATPQDAKPQDATPQDAKPHDAKPQEAKPQEAKPQDANSNSQNIRGHPPPIYNTPSHQ